MDQWPKKHDSSEDLMNLEFHCRKRADPNFPWGTLKIYEMRYGFRELGVGDHDGLVKTFAPPL
jgi:hypothetical protein